MSGSLPSPSGDIPTWPHTRMTLEDYIGQLERDLERERRLLDALPPRRPWRDNDDRINTEQRIRNLEGEIAATLKDGGGAFGG